MEKQFKKKERKTNALNGKKIGEVTRTMEEKEGRKEGKTKMGGKKREEMKGMKGKGRKAGKVVNIVERGEAKNRGIEEGRK